MARTSARFIPRLEAFDERSLPSVAFTEGAGTLLIVGDNTPNQITILDDGTGLAGAVIVQADGETYISREPVTNIVVETKGGTDTVDYWLQGTLLTDRLVSVDLGRRADTFTAHLNDQTVDGGVRLVIGAFGRGGADRLTLDAVGINVGALGHFGADFQGGAGKDVVTFNYVPGLVDGTVSLMTDEQQ
jgi:hypothetical protein